MSKHNEIQSFFWIIARFDPFFMRFCPTSANKIAGIGSIFLIQFIIAFISGHILLKLINVHLTVSFIAGLTVVIALWQYIKYSTKYLSTTFASKNLKILLLYSIVGTFIITLPLILNIFQSEIESELYLYDIDKNVKVEENIWKLSYGLYLLIHNSQYRLTVFLVYTTVFLLTLFIAFYPYVLLYQNKKNLYYKIVKLYEEKFT